MTVDKLAHGEDWRGEDLTGWYLSEKFDGCRAFWDGHRMWTRQGNEIVLPLWFRRGLPAVTLDGEIWCGYGTLGRASEAVRLGRIRSDCAFLVFDAPEAGGDWMDRVMSAELSLMGSDSARLVHITACESSEHAVSMMRMIQQRGGEGVVARKPGVAHLPGRSRDILKVKREPAPESERVSISFELAL